MANSKLVDKKFALNSNVVSKVLSFGRENLSNRIHNYINQGYMTYDDLKNYIGDYEGLDGESKKQNGGDIFYNWAKNKLNHSRDIVKNTKMNHTNMGFSNKYIKPHNKNLSNSAIRKGLHENIITRTIIKEINKLNNG